MSSSNRTVVASGRATQPIPARHESLSQRHTNSEAKCTLRYFIGNITPVTLHSQIGNSLDYMSPSAIDRLLEAFASSGAILSNALHAIRDTTNYHCVRCHINYFERDNALGQCMIRHAQPQLHPAPGRVKPAAASSALVAAPANPTVPEVAQPLKMMFPCCRIVVPVGSVPGPCFRGRHTTQSVNVAYNPRSVRTCEMHGCLAHNEAARAAAMTQAMVPRV